MDFEPIVARCMRTRWGKSLAERFGHDVTQAILREELKRREALLAKDEVNAMSAAMVATLGRCKAQGAG